LYPGREVVVLAAVQFRGREVRRRPVPVAVAVTFVIVAVALDVTTQLPIDVRVSPGTGLFCDRSNDEIPAQ